MANNYGRLFNFSAGPGVLPLEVLEEAQKDLLNYKNSGVSIMEMSHRSKIFEHIIQEAENDLRKILNVPKNYKVLFMQGGATAQFAAIPLNLIGDKTCVDYVITGNWGIKALEEVSKFNIKANTVTIPKNGKFSSIPPESEWKYAPNAAYVHYTDNETVHGVEFPFIPNPPSDTILVCDMSSNFLSKPVDISKFGLIYAGAQKNCGIAGLTIVIIREDLLNLAKPETPTALHYKIFASSGSLYYTPPCWSIYIAGLVFKWILKEGGIEVLHKKNLQKAALIYDVIDNSSFYIGMVEKPFRSSMNVTFNIKDSKLEDFFVSEAEKNGLLQLKGHRTLGGLRASLYNAMPLEGVEKLANFMKEFEKKYSSK